MDDDRLTLGVAAALLLCGASAVAGTWPISDFMSPHGQKQVRPSMKRQRAQKCDGEPTVDVNRCLAKREELSEARSRQYLEAAERRIRSEPVTTRVALAKSQKAFEVYRTAECGALFQFWNDGTIRTAKEMECNIRLTDARTHTLWENWLRYVDSTPPILPEPAPTPF